MESPVICSTCLSWQMKYPCGVCRHPNAEGLTTSNEMVFQDAGKLCPKNALKYRLERLKDTKSIIEELSKECQKNGIKGAVIGISGGKDSTVVAKLMVECLGKENVLGVLMPNGEQSDIEDSVRVVELLGIEAITVNIHSSFDNLVDSVTRELQYLGSDLTKASRINIAPRIRMTTLYAIAQSMGSGWRVVGTTNKSEDYIGWLTKWGDGGVDFEPIIDLTVTEVVQLGLNLGLPEDLVCKTPIDGLAEGSDEERIGVPYKMIDKYIYEGTTENALLDEKIEKLYFYSNHKRTLIPRYVLKY